MHTYITHRIKVSLGLLALTLLSVLTLGVSSASALSGSEFDPGYIIDDAVFYDRSTMNPDQIQAFLDAKVPVCDTNGTQLIYDSAYGDTVTRATYSSRRGISTPFTCLKDYTETIPTIINSGSNLCTGNISGATKSAAQIIHDVAQACGINPQVLIVLLQKEQSLVSDTWPWPRQYRSATGYGCPDTAPCDAEYYGYFNQVYQAAKAYKRYAANPDNYNYRYGRNNYVLYNPNTACGGTNVYIQNQATASLYIYTPYQPNAAALNNLYGSGDGCSAYGNRNFWRMFNDWFGSTRGSYLLRSPENATVYMVVDSMKYPIASSAIMNALYPLGPVKYVSQDYLNEKTTGTNVGRLLRSENGTIYFYDAGIKLAFSSCELIAHYGFGASCSVNYINLTDTMLSKLVTGPNMTRVFGTTTGKSFYIESGTKREIYDETAKQAAGITAGANVLNESAISNLTYGVPVVRNNTIIKSRTTGSMLLRQQGINNPISPTLISQSALSKSLTTKQIDEQSVSLLPKASDLTGFISNSSGTQRYVLDGLGKAQLTNPEEWSATYETFDDSLLALLPNSTQPVNNMLVKTPTNGTVYYIEAAKKRPIYDWGDLLRLKPTPLTISTISTISLDSVPDGPRLVGPARLIKGASSATVYLVDGTEAKYPITTFNVPINMGTGLNLITVPDSLLDQYTTKPATLGVKVTCEGKNYIGSEGKLYEVDSTMQTYYGLSYEAINSVTCANMAKSGTLLNRFILDPTGTIYYVENGQKKPFRSYTTFLSYGGTSSNTVFLSSFSAQSLPTGPAI